MRTSNLLVAGARWSRRPVVLIDGAQESHALRRSARNTQVARTCTFWWFLEPKSPKETFTKGSRATAQKAALQMHARRPQWPAQALCGH